MTERLIELAADVAGDDAEAAFRHLEDVAGQAGAVGVHALERRVDGVMVLGPVVIADAAPGLNGVGGDAVDHELLFDDVVGLGEGFFGRLFVAAEMDEADVVGAIVPYQRRARLGRVPGRDYRRQGIVIDVDKLGGVLGLIEGFGDDESDGIADAPDPVRHQGREVGHIHRRSVAPFAPAARRHIAVTRRRPVLAGEDAEHARRRLGLGNVDRGDLGVGVGRAQDVAERHAPQHDIVDIAPAALEQPRVLGPWNRLPKRVFTHYSFPALR